jgi:hypothetical protein
VKRWASPRLGTTLQEHLSDSPQSSVLSPSVFLLDMGFEEPEAFVGDP